MGGWPNHRPENARSRSRRRAPIGSGPAGVTSPTGMVAVTSVMRAHQILLARVENALRPYDLSFSRFELLRLLAFSRTGALPITKASDRLQVHVTSVTHAIRRLEADGTGATVTASHRRSHHAGRDHRAGPVHRRGRDRHAQRARCSPTSGCRGPSRRRWWRRSRRCGAAPATSNAKELRPGVALDDGAEILIGVLGGELRVDLGGVACPAVPPNRSRTPRPWPGPDPCSSARWRSPA